MNSKIMKELATNPRAHMDVQATGRLPRLRYPLQTPLLQLLKSMGPRERGQYRGVRVSPDIGYQCKHEFPTAEHLFRWLGGNEQILERKSIPGESFAIRNFRKTLTVDDLKAHSQIYPGQAASPRPGA